MKAKNLSQVLFWLTFIFIGCQTLTPAPLASLTQVNDKLSHLAAFASLGCLIKFAWPILPLPKSFLLLISYGIGIELAQYFIPGREFSVADILADGLGVILGLAVYQLIRLFLLRWE